MSGKLIFLLLLLVILSSTTFGGVAPPFSYTLRQPNGIEFEVRMFGDENLNWVETMDRSVIIDVLDDDNNIWWYYATIDSEGYFAPSDILVGGDVALDLSGRLELWDIQPKRVTRFDGKFHRVAEKSIRDVHMLAADPNTPSILKPIVFLVDFPGKLPGQMPSHRYTQSQFEKLLFAERLNPENVNPPLPDTYKMSVRDYFTEVSDGKFTVSGSIDSIIDWKTTKHGYSYYVDENQGFGGGPNGISQSAYAVCAELAQAVDNVVNFANFDGDQNGVVDLVILIMEGWFDGSKNQFWDFQDILYSVKNIDPNAPASFNEFLMLDGKIIKRFIVAPEQAFYNNQPDFDQGDIQPIGTFCVEIGYALDLPGLYDMDTWPDSNSIEPIISSGIGYWGLMGFGCWNRRTSPAYICAWSRSRLNWITTELLETGMKPERISVPPAEYSHLAYKILINPNDASEYFLLENRRRIGSDKYLMGEGLLIWHIDENFTERWINRVNCIESTYGVNLIQADGAGHLYKNIDANKNDWNYGDNGDPFPGSSGNTAFTFSTNPNSNSYQYDRDADGKIDLGYNSQVSITNISQDANGAISCTVTSPNYTGFEIGYDIGGFNYYDTWGENRAGILVYPTSSSYLKSIRTVFVCDSFDNHVDSYTIRVWEGFDDITGFPQTLINSQSGNVDWSASAPQHIGGWVTIPIKANIFCQSGEKYYIEIQYEGSGYIMPCDDCYYCSDRPPSERSFYRESGLDPCQIYIYGDWNIRAIFGL
jgi:M6 family metalloprotease-like protein